MGGRGPGSSNRLLTASPVQSEVESQRVTEVKAKALALNQEKFPLKLKDFNSAKYFLGGLFVVGWQGNGEGLLLQKLGAWYFPWRATPSAPPSQGMAPGPEFGYGTALSLKSARTRGV